MMTVGVERSGSKLKIEKDRLLLVEGRDEGNLFGALIRHHFGEKRGSKIQVIEAGGKDKFPNNLRAITAEARSFRAIGVVRDADENASGAFRSICDYLRSVGYEPPTAHGRFSDAEPTIGVFIVPDGNTPGAIETLCKRSREGDAVSRCVEDYMSCLDGRGAIRSGNRDKTFAHAYLAATADPVARVGEGALRGVWDFDSDAFADLSAFLRELLSV